MRMFPITLLLTAAGSAAAQSMYIEGCNLDCTSGAGGQQVTCGSFEVTVSGDLRARFSKPVDLASVTSSTFRIVDVANGTSPQGSFFVEPADAQVLVFRPDVTFDALGNPVFGFGDNRTYQVMLPGTAQGDPLPHVLSIDGDPNASRMLCTILTSLAWPGPVQEFCPPAPYSAGPGALMGWTGGTSVATDDLVLEVSGAVPGEFGIFFLSDGQTGVPAGDGLRCIGGMLQRLPPVLTIDMSGRASRAFDLANLPPGVGAILPGSTWTTQMAYRDGAAGGAGFNWSSGLILLFVP
ncbi:MAG: Ig-like domain-containing protein [Planctomycetota bacterium]|nr:Ig-like domain-containing protein [Planctomycetota bacterium]